MLELLTKKEILKKMIRLHHFQNPEERLFVIHFHQKQQFKDLF